MIPLETTLLLHAKLDREHDEDEDENVSGGLIVKKQPPVTAKKKTGMRNAGVHSML